MPPPMAAPRADKYTLMPPAARSRAACMPPIPPPTTRAAPMDCVLDSSDGMGNDLRCRRLLISSLPDCQEVQGQRAIDHVRPLAERHFNDQHGRRNDDMQGVHKVTGKTKTEVAEDMCGETA